MDKKTINIVTIIALSVAAITVVVFLILGSLNNKIDSTPVTPPPPITETLKPTESPKVNLTEDELLEQEMNRERGIAKEDKDHINNLPFTKDLFEDE